MLIKRLLKRPLILLKYRRIQIGLQLLLALFLISLLGIIVLLITWGSSTTTTTTVMSTSTSLAWTISTEHITNSSRTPISTTATRRTTITTTPTSLGTSYLSTLTSTASVNENATIKGKGSQRLKDYIYEKLSYDDDDFDALIHIDMDYDLAGILVIGGESGSASKSVEFWSAADPEQGSCVLGDFPRGVRNGPTANLVSGRLVACYNFACHIYQDEGSWRPLQNTTVSRVHHSSVSTEEAVLLIGGDYSNSTEWIPMDGFSVQLGPFTVQHGDRHCTIQLSDNVIVVTGGWDTLDVVTQYHLAEGTETPLTGLGQPRDDHACGVYQDADDQQVSLKVSVQNLLIMPVSSEG